MAELWIPYSETKPRFEGAYEWRLKSQRCEGLVLIFCSKMRWRGSCGENVLSPCFDYWDGWNVRVPHDAHWRNTDSKEPKRPRGVYWNIGYEDAIADLPCPFCGKVPELEAMDRPVGGGAIFPQWPHHFNTFKHSYCCEWMGGKTMNDPRTLTGERNAAILSISHKRRLQ